MDDLHPVQEFEAHPFAEILPLIEGEAFDELVENIRRNGLLQPICIFEGRILDGRNRYRACKAADVPFYRGQITEFHGNSAEALDYVEASNIARRQLTPSQKAMVAASLTTLRRGLGKAQSGADGVAVTVDEAAERLDVSPFLVKQARKVRKEASPNIVAMVEKGDLALAAANKIADFPREQQEKLASGDEARRFLYGDETHERQATRKITAGLINRTFGDLAELTSVPADQIIALLEPDDRDALAELLPQYSAFLESLRAVLAGGEECQAAG